MRRLLVVSCFGFMLALMACSNEGGDSKEQSAEQLIKIEIPESYFKFTGETVESNASSLEGLGSEYVSSVNIVEESIQLTATEEQRDNLIERNEETAKNFLTEFSESSEVYSYKESVDYSSLEVYYDEKLAINTQLNAIFGVAAAYGLNQILQGNDEEWTVNIKIYNCHTQKLVVEMDIPQDEVSFGAEEWEKSYEE